MSQHTAGPWRYSDGLILAKNTKIADYSQPYMPFAEEDANARLIAAATTAPHECDDPTCSGAINKRKLDAFPELLEACKAAKQAIANAISFVNDEAAPTSSTEISTLFAQLYAAIAKATE